MGAGESPMMDSAYSLTPEEIAAAVEACGEKPWEAPARKLEADPSGSADAWKALQEVE